MTLKARCCHLAVAGLFLWSLGVSGICEARCLELALGAAKPGQSSASPSPAEPQPRCHGDVAAGPPERAQSLDPSASGGEPGCHCVHTDDALLQQRGDGGRQDDVLAALAHAPRALLSGMLPQWRAAAPSTAVSLAPHQYRNLPLLI